MGVRIKLISLFLSPKDYLFSFLRRERGEERIERRKRRNFFNCVTSLDGLGSSVSTTIQVPSFSDNTTFVALEY